MTNWITLRMAIKGALDSVDGINGHEYSPNPPQPGDGWMHQGSMVVDNRANQFMRSFVVVVMAPQNDERQAYAWFELHWEEIADALEQYGYLDRVDMVQINQSQWAAQFSLRSE